MPDEEKRAGRLRRALHRLSADETEIDAEILQTTAVDAGATCVRDAPLREPVCLAGTLRSVVLRPRAGTPSLEAELYDGSGSVTLVWLGRRRIAGIEAGRSLVVRGRIAQSPDGLVVFNPRYELRLPNGGDRS